MIFCQQTTTQSFGFLLPSIVTGMVAVLLFIIGRIIDSKIKQSEQRKSWYLKVLLEPNVEKIEVFFNTSIEKFELTLNLLHQNSKLSHSEFIVLKSGEFKKFNDLKRSFEFDFICLVCINHSDLNQNLIDLSINLEDVYKSKLDVDNLANHSKILDDFKNEANRIRVSMYQAIYKPLEYKKRKPFDFIVRFFR